MTCRGPRTCRTGFSRRTDSANARTARSSVTHCSPRELWVQSISSRWHDSLIRLATESLLRDSSTSTLPATRECCSCTSRCRKRVCLKRTSRRASIDVVPLATSISVTSFIQAPTDSCFILLCPAGLARPRLRSRSIFAETRTGLTTRLTNSPPESVRKVGVEAPPPFRLAHTSGEKRADRGGQPLCQYRETENGCLQTHFTKPTNRAPPCHSV